VFPRKGASGQAGRVWTNINGARALLAQTVEAEVTTLLEARISRHGYSVLDERKHLPAVSATDCQVAMLLAFMARLPVGRRQGNLDFTLDGHARAVLTSAGDRKTPA
jgi:hypothetical protein